MSESSKSWHLVDADEIARAHKYTFYKPATAVLWKVRPGELVKLIFAFESSAGDDPSAERMWVKVSEVFPELRFRGELDNDPGYIKDLKAGETIEFEGKHIINTAHDDHDNLVNQFIKRCYVTNRVLYERQRVGYLYREPPDRDNDSGWRFTGGDETQEYMDDASNFSYVSLGAVLNVDDSFVDLLGAPEEAHFARDPHTDRFVAVDADN